MPRPTAAQLTLRSIGVLTLVATLLFVGLFVATLLTQSASGRESLADWFSLSLLVMCLGLLVMIGHLHLTRDLSPAEKGTWRAHLWWGGPLVAGYYLSRQDRRLGRRVIGSPDPGAS